MQIYNEKIYDLLQDKKREAPLQLREAARGAHTSVHVLGLSSYRVYCPEDVLRLLRKGSRSRAVRETEENNESSRSHSVLQLEVQLENLGESGTSSLRKATLSLVDLAGSEKWRATLNQVRLIDRWTEYINLYISRLNNCHHHSAVCFETISLISGQMDSNLGLFSQLLK